MKIFYLNEDWPEFEPAYRRALQDLGATDEEIEALLDGAWNAVEECRDVKELAAVELQLHAAPAHARRKLQERVPRARSRLWPVCARGHDLEGAKLCGAKLCGAKLENADLEGADLRGAKLEA